MNKKEAPKSEDKKISDALRYLNEQQACPQEE